MAAACLTGAAYGALNKSSEGGLLLRSTSCDAALAARGVQTREATIVSAELDDEAAVIICPREGGGGPVQSRS